MTRSADASGITPHAELFAHSADVGVRGVGPTLASAMEQAALAMTMAVTDPAGIVPQQQIEIACAAPNDAFLLVEWLNALIYEMAVRRMVFARFEVAIADGELHGRAWGEPIDRARHRPAAELKGATMTALTVGRRPDGAWVAQCIVDV